MILPIASYYRDILSRVRKQDEQAGCLHHKGKASCCGAGILPAFMSTEYLVTGKSERPSEIPNRDAFQRKTDARSAKTPPDYLPVGSFRLIYIVGRRADRKKTHTSGISGLTRPAKVCIYT